MSVLISSFTIRSFLDPITTGVGMDQKKHGRMENTVFVGKKPNMSYVLAVVTQFNTGQSEVRIRARGHAISKAVDVAEIVRNKFVQEAKVSDIKIGTEEVLAGDDKLNI